MRASKEKRDRFLELIREGKSRPEAAAEVGLTGTVFRALCNPVAHNYDAEFATAYQAALEERTGVRVEQYRDEIHFIAMDRGNPSQLRAIQTGLILHDPEYREAQRQRLAVGARADGDGKVEVLLAFEVPGGDG